MHSANKDDDDDEGDEVGAGKSASDALEGKER